MGNILIYIIINALIASFGLCVGENVYSRLNFDFYKGAKKALLERNIFEFTIYLKNLNEFRQKKQDENKNTLLHHYCATKPTHSEMNQEAYLFTLLKNRNFDYLDSQNINGETPLMLAAQSDNLIAMQLLLFNQYAGNSAEIDLKDHRGNTALHHALLNENNLAVKCLLANNANTAILGAEKLSPLMLAALLGNHKALSRLLDKPTKNRQELLDSQDIRGWTALHHAVVGKNPKCVKLLLTTSISWDKKDKRNRTAYNIAQKLKLKPIVSKFKSAGNYQQKPHKTKRSSKKSELPIDPDNIIPDWHVRLGYSTNH